MGKTEIDGDKILDGSIQKKDIDTTTVGQSVITSISGIDGLELVSSSGADEGTGHVVLRSAGGFGTEYYSFRQTPEQQTTSNIWVQAALFTTPIIPSGRYIIHYKAQLTNTNKKAVGFEINIREDASPFIGIESTTKSPATANIYETRGSFEEFILNSDNTLDIQINFGQTTEGGTGKIRNIVVYLFRVGDL